MNIHIDESAVEINSIVDNFCFFLILCLFIPLVMSAMQTQKFPCQAKLLINIKINLKLLFINGFTMKEIVADEIHASKKTFKFFLHLLLVHALILKQNVNDEGFKL